MACIPYMGPTRPIVTGIQRLLPVHSTPCSFPSSSLTSKLHTEDQHKAPRQADMPFCINGQAVS